LKKTLLPGGNFITYSYDPNGNVTKMAAEPNNGEPNIVASYEYEPIFNFIKKITDPNGEVTTLDYNEYNGNLNSITLPQVPTLNGDEIPIIRFKYNDYGQLIETNSPDGIITKYDYYDANSFYKLKKITRDYGTNPNCENITTEYVYDHLGNIAEIKNLGASATQPNESDDYIITQFKYNNLNQLIQMMTMGNNSTIFHYNKAKKLAMIEREIEGPNQITNYSYDILDNLKSITNPLGYVTKVGHDASENLADVNDAEDNKTKYDYDERDLLWKVTDANGNVTEYSYTPNGQLAKIKDANGNETTYHYDGFERLKWIQYPNDTNEAYTYDKNSNIKTYKNRADQIITYRYDALSRLIAKTRPGETEMTNTTLWYDIAGRLKEVRKGTISILESYYYDRIGRVIDVENANSNIVSYEYDKLGRRKKMTYPDDTYILYYYDSMSRLTDINDQSNNCIVHFSYDELGRRVSSTYGNGTGADYGYDLANQLQWVINDIDSDITFEYTSYDKVGNRKNMFMNNDESTYTYDKLYQLIRADYPAVWSTTDVNYYYDKVGNRTSTSSTTATAYMHNNLNQYYSIGTTTCSYDDNGNLKQYGNWRYYYDCENRLTDVNLGTIKRVHCSYDYLGRRVSRSVGTSSPISYVYDGQHIIAEYDNTGNLLRKYIYSDRIDEPVCLIETIDENRKYYYHYDGLGSVVALTDSSGVKVRQYRYDAFGGTTITNISSRTIANRFMFTAREYDYEGLMLLYYYRARHYRPNIGRFLQPDPIGYADSMNLYQYCLNNPLNFTDPSGLLVGKDHEQITRRAMKKAGFLNPNIDLAVKANKRVDRLTNQFNNPAHYMPGTSEEAEKMVKGQLKKAKRLKDGGKIKESMQELGKGLHTLQDKYPHEKRGSWWNHIKGLAPGVSSPDDDWGNPSDNAYKDTEEYINEYNKP
jgi:RHS repeat-associated protein